MGVGIKQFLRIPDAAKLTGLSARHFRNLAKRDGLIKPFSGRKHFVLRVDLEAWAKRNGIEMKGSVQ